MKKDEMQTIEEIGNSYDTDLVNGLTSAEAKARLEKNGRNELKEKKKKTWFQVFLSQLKDPMIYVLFAAVAVTTGVSIYETVKAGANFNFLSTGDWPDVLIIIAVIIINAVIGTIQEIKAQTSLDALKQMSSPESTVIRDGKHMRIKAYELVLGDVVVIEEGDTIGADLRLIESANLKANESSLTGESVPVEKNAMVTFDKEAGIGDRVNMVYMSTPVAYGRGVGVVVKTGMDTEIGKIAGALEEEKPELTPLQRVLANLSKILGFITLGIVGLVLVVSLTWIFIDGKGTQLEAYIEALLSAISLAVAAVPEGLAAVVTIVLSLGVQKMVKANTIVRKLPSVETLGAVSVVCSDKTGTLTQNKMTVVKAFSDYNYLSQEEFNEANESSDLRLLAKGLSLCSNATVDEGLYGDPTEIALVQFANEFNLHKHDLQVAEPRVDELPFDSVRKMMSTLHKKGDKTIVYTKGALDSIMARTSKVLINGVERDITDADIETIYNANRSFSDEALRVLALAYSYQDEIVEQKLVFVGLVAMIDPARKEAAPAVAEFKNAGIRTVMITGDHKDTAFAIAKNLGICEVKEQCYLGADVDKMSEVELQEVCKDARVFARVSPENKVQIVNAFKANGNIVAMTGDGVNDAPSLKAADIGIAMGITGTDVAKGAADMVLTDDNFASIEKAVEEGRGIYSNIKKTILFLLSSNIVEVFIMLILIAVGLPTPFIAIHLLWVNLITDSLPAIALGMQPKSPDCMKEKPRDPNESIFARGGVKTIAIYGTVITLAGIIAYLMPAWLAGKFSYSDVKAYYDVAANLAKAQTMAFVVLAFSELIHMLGMSDPNHSFVHVFKDKNYMMAIAFFAGIILQIAVVEIPGINAVFSTSSLGIALWGIAVGLALVPLLVHEIIVFVNYIRNKKSK